MPGGGEGGSDPVNNGRTVYLAQGKESYLPWQVVILCPFTHPSFFTRGWPNGEAGMMRNTCSCQANREMYSML